MAEVKKIQAPTEVGKGEYNPQSTMTPEQQAEAAKKHKASKARAMGQRGKSYKPPPNVEPERLGGGLTEAEMNVEAPGPPTVVRQQARSKQDVRIQKVTPKAAPKKDLTAKQIGGLKQKTPSQMGVDVKTGKPKPTKTYGERAISYLEGLGSKVAPPGSVTRLREKPEGPASTMKTRMESIGRVSAKSFPGREKASRPGGLLNIPELAGRTKGPSLKSQQGTPAAAYRRKQFREKTAADVPSHGAGARVPTGDERTKVEVLEGPRKATKEKPGHLGSYRVTGTPAPKVEEKKVSRAAPAKTTKRQAPTPPDKPSIWGKIWGGIKTGAKEFQKAGQEMTAQAKTSKAPSGKYGTKEQAQKAAKGVKKAVVPKTFKEKK